MVEEQVYVYVYGRTIEEFSEKVQEFIGRGYFPYGGVNVTSQYLYSQAMVLRSALVELIQDAIGEIVFPSVEENAPEVVWPEDEEKAEEKDD